MVEKWELETGASRCGLAIVSVEEHPERSNGGRGVVVRQAHDQRTSSPPLIASAANPKGPHPVDPDLLVELGVREHHLRRADLRALLALVPEGRELVS